MKIVNSYVEWGKQTTRRKAVIAYETMWKSTEKMAYSIVDGLVSEGIDVKMYDVAETDSTEIIREMLYARGYLFGSSTHDNGMLPNLAMFLEFLKGLKPSGRKAAAFGSFGWGGGAVKEMEKFIATPGIEIVQPGISLKFVPSPEELKQCFEFGKEFAKKLT